MRPSLLVIDDDSTIRALLHTALEGQYDILCVPNGPEVPALIADRKPDLIVLDINVPGSDAYALCSSVREQDKLCARPILFMTACQSDGEFFNDLRSSGNSYLKKPFEMPALRRRISGMLASFSK